MNVTSDYIDSYICSLNEEELHQQPITSSSLPTTKAVFTANKTKPALTNMTVQDFLQWNVTNLQTFLSERLINQKGNKATLAQNAFYAYSLNLPVQVQSAQEEQQEIVADRT